MLVDLDTWGASVAQVLGLVDEAPGVAAAARASEQGTLDVPGLARLAPEVVPGLRVLTGLPKADRWPELRVAAIEDILRLSRGVVDHVVVDVGVRGRGRRGAELRHGRSSPQRLDPHRAGVCRPPRRRGAADPVGLQRLVRAVQDVAVLPSPRPTVVVNKVRSIRGRAASGACDPGCARSLRGDGRRPVHALGPGRLRRGRPRRALPRRGRSGVTTDPRRCRPRGSAGRPRAVRARGPGASGGAGGPSDTIGAWQTGSAHSTPRSSTSRTRRPRCTSGRSWCSTPRPGGFDYESLVTLISERIAHVPRYRQRIRSVAGRPGQPRLGGRRATST